MNTIFFLVTLLVFFSSILPSILSSFVAISLIFLFHEIPCFAVQQYVWTHQQAICTWVYLLRVNRLTGIYNAVSVQHGIPLGDEVFGTSSGEERPEVGEVVWCDEEGVTCRRWNWRQCRRTGLTEGTTSALFILDALMPLTEGELEGAGEELVGALEESSPGLAVAKRLIRAEVDRNTIEDTTALHV